MPIGRLSRAAATWREFRAHQRAELAAGHHSHPDLPRPDLADGADGADGVEPAASPESLADPVQSVLDRVHAEPPVAGRFGPAGQPLNRHSPFYLGFFGALGAVVAVGLWGALGRLATTLTILLVAVFLTLSLNPLVERLSDGGRRRGRAVAVVFAALLVVLALLGRLVVPAVATQGADLVQRAPEILQNLIHQPWIERLDANYKVITRLQQELSSRLTDETFLRDILGGILGAGQIVISGVFQILTILVLTLYFLVSFPRMKQAAFDLVPASRRQRVASLSEEIMRRVGAYAIGQVGVASIHAALIFIVLSLLGIPYAAVLAVTAGTLGLIPMVGATLGAVVVVIVSAFQSPTKALVVLVFYVVYQQVENYIVAPRVMRHTVAVPGAVTIVAALVGGTLLGVVGALLAIPVAAGLLLLYDEVLVPRQESL